MASTSQNIKNEKLRIKDFITHVLHIYSIINWGFEKERAIDAWGKYVVDYMQKQIIPNIPLEFVKAPEVVKKMSRKKKNDYLDILIHIIKFPETLHEEIDSGFRNYLNYKNLSFVRTSRNPFDIIAHTKTGLNCMGYSTLLSLVTSYLGLYGIIFHMAISPRHAYGISSKYEKELTSKCYCAECNAESCYEMNTCSIIRTQDEVLKVIIKNAFSFIKDDKKKALESYAKFYHLDMNFQSNWSIITDSEALDIFRHKLNNDLFKLRQFVASLYKYRPDILHLLNWEFLCELIVYLDAGSGIRSIRFNKGRITKRFLNDLECIDKILRSLESDTKDFAWNLAHLGDILAVFLIGVEKNEDTKETLLDEFQRDVREMREGVDHCAKYQYKHSSSQTSSGESEKITQRLKLQRKKTHSKKMREKKGKQ